MLPKDKIQFLLELMSNEVYEFIKMSQADYNDGWVPAVFIKEKLNLKRLACPQGNNENETGWLFGIIARHLEDTNRIVYRRAGNRAFCKCRD